MTRYHVLTAARVNWGDVPTWISALAAFIALLAAGTAGYFTYRTYRIESRRDEIHAEERRRRDSQEVQAQASRVSAWFDETSDPPVAGSGEVRVMNGSTAPVYHVNVGVMDDRREMPQRLSLTVLPPTRTAINLPLPEPLGSRDAHKDPGPRVQITFTDASGERWLRNRFGRLTSLAKDLRIWSGDDIEGALSRFKDDFKYGYGLNLSYDTTVVGDALRKKFLAEARRPDACPVDVLVAPHDWLGELTAAHLIQPVAARTVSNGDSIVRTALRELTRDGSQFGIPTTIDTVILLRNKKLAPTAPSTFESLVAMGRELQEAGAVSRVACVSVGPAGDPFAVWPIFSGGGGRLFGTHPDGTWDEHAIEIDDPKSVQAFGLLATLGAPDLKILDTTVNQARARDLFFAGESAFLFDVYGAARHENFETIDVGFSAIPPLRGRACSGFYSIYGFYIAANATNRQIAEDFIPHYLERSDVAHALSEGLSSVVISGDSIATANDAARVTLQACLGSAPMPSFPQMPQVWAALGNAEVSVLDGADPRAVARQVAGQIRDAWGTAV